MYIYFAFITAPLTVLHKLLTLISLLWLIYLFQFNVILVGIVVWILSQMLLGYLMLCSLPFSAKAMKHMDESKLGFVSLYMVISLLIDVMVLSAFCLAVLYFFMNFSTVHSTSFVPALILSYCITGQIIEWIAGRDLQGGTSGTLLTSAGIQIAHLCSITLISIYNLSFENIVTIFGIFALVIMIIHTSIILASFKNR